MDNRIAREAYWVYQSRKKSGDLINPKDFDIYSNTISKWEKMLRIKGYDPEDAAILIVRAFKIYLYDEL